MNRNGSSGTGRYIDFGKCEYDIIQHRKHNGETEQTGFLIHKNLPEDLKIFDVYYTPY